VKSPESAHGIRWLFATVVALAPLTTGCEALREIISSISDGASCDDAGQCLGGTCLTESDGYPGGYCTTLQCETQGCTNIFGSECLLFERGNDEPTCYLTCDVDDDCRDRYRCIDSDGARVCLPNELTEGIPAAGEIGTSCARDNDCDGEACLLNFPGGYCTVMNCEEDSVCERFGDGRCLEQGEDDNSFFSCFDGCDDDSECRFGYGCTDSDGFGGVCEPLDEANPVRNPNGEDDGRPCVVDINCKGGTCLRTEEGYPDGYCTTLSCSTLGCNGSDTLCRSFENGTACFETCTSDNECRDGYDCLADSYCGPPITTTTGDDPTGTIDIVCDSEAISGGRRFNFTIDSDTRSFGVVALTDFAEIRPSRLRLPDGSTGANFDTDYAFFDINWQILINIVPTFFPAAPQFEFITEQGGGTYSLDVETNDSNPCFYVLESDSPGTRIAVNLYFVGVPGVSAASAPNDRDIVELMDTFEQVYNGAGIELATVRYFDITGIDRDSYRIIRDFNQINELLSLSSSPGSNLVDLLSINVFLIEDFAIPQIPGLLGLSAGLPGVPGLHGNHGAGLVFTSVSVGLNNEDLGLTMAHEIGHFNGLRHTTEHDFTADPISDTPQCSNPNNGASCPDATNLMFPFSIAGVSQTIITTGQQEVLQWSPLTY
jgi:hypothetical protein